MKPTVSILIPVMPGESDPVRLVSTLLGSDSDGIEIVVSPFQAIDPAGPLMAMSENDPRLLILDGLTQGGSVAQLWNRAITASSGRWLTLVRPNDMLDADLVTFVEINEKHRPDIDVFGWNSFRIDAEQDRSVPSAVAIPCQHHLMDLSKSEMIETFFLWRDCSATPLARVGLYHGLVRRDLAETILETAGPTGWLTPVPDIEWITRLLIYGNSFAFSTRPLSAIAVEAFKPVDVPSVMENFPFLASQGLTGAVAEVQARVLSSLGAVWNGFNDNFLRAMMIDCMGEKTEESFEKKAQAYHKAILATGHAAMAQAFRPPFAPKRQPDTRRGRIGGLLFVDRFIGNARTAQDFYEVVRDMLTPLDLTNENEWDLSMARRAERMVV